MSQQQPHYYSTLSFEDILGACLSADNNHRREGEAALKHKLTTQPQPATHSELLHLTQNSPHPEIRQLSALIVRRRIPAVWKHLDPATQAQTKTILLNQLVTDPQRAVRIALAHVLVAVAKCSTEDWTELWDFLAQGASAGIDVGIREVCVQAMKLLLAENVSSVVEKRLSLVMGVIVKAMNDDDLRVRVQALHAMAELVEWLGDTEELKQVSQYMPHMLSIMKTCLESGNEDLTTGSFEMLEELAGSAVPVVVPHLALVVEFLIAVVVGNGLDMSTRQQAMAALTAMMRSRPKALVKRALVPQFINCALSLSVCVEDTDVMDDDSDVTPHKLGLQLVDAMCEHFSAKHILPSLSQFVIECKSNPDPWRRRTAQVCLAVMSEGLHQKLLPQLPTLLPIVLEATRDPESRVREFACLALAQFSEYLTPDIAKYTDVILPCIFGALHDPNIRVQEKACFALEGFATHLSNEDDTLASRAAATGETGDANNAGNGNNSAIAQYLPQLVRTLIGILARPKFNTSAPLGGGIGGAAASQDASSQDDSARKHEQSMIDLYEIAISALCATVKAGKEGYVPYVHDSMAVLMPAMALTSDHMLVIRARATNCIGAIATAVPHDAFIQYVPQVMDLVISGLDLEFTELREATYELFTNIAEMLKEKFQPYLASTVSWLLASCRSNDGIFSIKGDGDGGDVLPQSLENLLDTRNNGGENQNGDSDDSDGEDGDGSFAVRTAFLDEKVAACDALGFIALHTGLAFTVHRLEAFATLVSLAAYFHADIRRSVLAGMQHILESTLRSRMVEPWTLVINQSCDLDSATHFASYTRAPPPISAEEQSMLEQVVTLCVECVPNEESKEVVAQSLMTLSSLLDLLGPHLQGSATKTVENVLLLLQKKAPCQETVDEDDGDVDVDADEEQLELLEGILCIFRSLAKAFGPHARPLLAPLYEDLLGGAGEVSGDEERAVCLGVLCEITHYMHGEAGDILQPGLALMLQGIADAGSSRDVRNSCVYGVGLLLSHMPLQHALTHAQHSLQALYQVFSNSASESDRVVDNACGSVARLILYQPHITLSHIAQIYDAFLQHLPLRVDLDEQLVVCRAIASVYSSSSQVFLERLDSSLNIVCDILATSDEDIAIISANASTTINASTNTTAIAGGLGLLVLMLKHIAAHHTQALHVAAEKLSVENRQVLTVALSH
eukprot:c10725_g1_i1.p1 GENE.c10725_g1_i1~~c10725_g1_i1.p1  ORF type:complete len:1209 (-),score=348.77 c10725_g1_i1:387-3959(-)